MSLSITGSAFPQQDFNTSASAAAGRSAVTTKSNEASTNSTQSTSKHNNQPTALPPAPAPAKLTEEQQLQQLVAEGQSTQQIATVLGLTVTQVEQSLAGTSTASTAASSVVALAGRLSVKV